MVNVVVFMGKIVKNDDIHKEIRYLEVVSDFKNNSNQFFKELIPVINWNKTNKGELFSFKENTLLLIKGRLEFFKEKFVVVCEQLTYIGKE